MELNKIEKLLEKYFGSGIEMSINFSNHHENPSITSNTNQDYLEEDPEIPTQRYVAISFLSPEKVLKQKSEFYNEISIRSL